jgi:hypothetical protein
VNTPQYLFSVALYLYDKDLDPDLVSKKLGICPTETQRKGERKISSRTGIEYAPAKCGMWELMADSDSPILSDHISELASRFGRDHLPFLSIEGVADGEIDVFMAGDTNENGNGKIQFELSEDCVAALKNLSLPIRFTVSFGKP